MTEPDRTRATVAFIILMGWVSFLAHICYAGVHSTIGPYLALLGASGTAIGVVAGIAELVGYGMHCASGSLVRMSRRYWLLTAVGYTVSLAVVPVLALVSSFVATAFLLVVTRLGQAIFGPAQLPLLSSAGRELRGLHYRRAVVVHQVLYHFGFAVGPLLVAAMLWWKGGIEGYRWAFAVLAIPAALSLIGLRRAGSRYPPARAMTREPPTAENGHLGRPFTVYLVAIALVGFGLATWPLLAFQIERRGLVSEVVVPVIYATAMTVDAIAKPMVFSSFITSRMALRPLALFLLPAAASLPLVLVGDAAAAVGGVILWVIGLGAVESIGAATVNLLAPPSRRRSAYALYYAVRGSSWCAGSIVIGILSDFSRNAAAIVGAISLAAAALTILAAGSAARAQRHPRAA